MFFFNLNFIKADILITNPDTIEILISKKKSIVAPLLTSFSLEYSNFKVKTYRDYYLSIYNRKNKGCFRVATVNDCYLMDLDDKNIQNLVNMEISDTDDDLFITQSVQSTSSNYFYI